MPLAITKLRIRNTASKAIDLGIEPLGEKVKLEPNGRYELTSTETISDLDYLGGGIVVFGWITNVSWVGEDGMLETIWEIPSEHMP